MKMKKLKKEWKSEIGVITPKEIFSANGHDWQKFSVSNDTEIFVFSCPVGTRRQVVEYYRLNY